MPSPMAELKEVVETQFDFLRNMGLKVLALEPNRVKLMLPMTGNENHLGILWAGALFTLAEVPGGILVYSTFDTDEFYPIVKEMNIKFLKPGKTDVTIEIGIEEGEARRLEQEARDKGKAGFTLNGEILDASGTVIAATQGFYQLRTY